MRGFEDYNLYCTDHCPRISSLLLPISYVHNQSDLLNKMGNSRVSTLRAIATGCCIAGAKIHEMMGMDHGPQTELNS